MLGMLWGNLDKEGSLGLRLYSYYELVTFATLIENNNRSCFAITRMKPRWSSWFSFLISLPCCFGFITSIALCVVIMTLKHNPFEKIIVL